MKKWLALPLCLGWMAAVLGEEEPPTFPYTCSGDYTCPDCPNGTHRAGIICLVSGEHQNSIWCHTEVEGDTLTCEARNGGEVVARDVVSCERCSGSGGGGGIGGCDPSLPFWWIFCNPFIL